MNPKVLLADDSATMRKIIVRLLDEVGVESPKEAADGAEAIAMFQADKFDLVLTDWNMPNKSGLELVHEIRAVNATIPIIMITTEGEKGRISEAIAAGVSDYIVKPFDRERLREKLEDNLNRRQPVEALPQWHPEFVARPAVGAAPSWDFRRT